MVPGWGGSGREGPEIVISVYNYSTLQVTMALVSGRKQKNDANKH